MKQYILLLLTSILLFFTACQKEYGYYEYTRLYADMSMEDALACCQEINAGDLQPTKDQRIRIQFFLYDDAGQLVNHQEKTINDYSASAEYELERVGLGDYTLIIATDRLVQQEGTLQPIYWDFSGTSQLSTFTVNGLNASDEMGERMLTLNRERFTIDGRRKSKSLHLKAMPVTAMVCVTYYDIFYWDKNLVGNDTDYRIYSYFDVNYEHDMNQVGNADGGDEVPWTYSETHPEECYILDRLNPDNLDAAEVSSYYSYHALLPGAYSFRGYGEYKYRGQSELYPDETRPSVQMHLQPNTQYFVDFDIKDWTISLEECTPAPALEAPSNNVRSTSTQSIRALDLPVSPVASRIADRR